MRKMTRKPKQLCSRRTSGIVMFSLLSLATLQAILSAVLSQTYRITIDLDRRVDVLEAGASAQPLIVMGPIVGESVSLTDKIDIAFMEEAHIAKAIAMCESRMQIDRVGDASLTFIGKDGIEYGKSYGLFQIRHLPGRPSPDKLSDPDFNIQYARKLWEKQGWQPWSCYSQGFYERFL